MRRKTVKQGSLTSEEGEGAAAMEEEGEEENDEEDYEEGSTFGVDEVGRAANIAIIEIEEESIDRPLIVIAHEHSISMRCKSLRRAIKCWDTIPLKSDRHERKDEMAKVDGVKKRRGQKRRIRRMGENEEGKERKAREVAGERREEERKQSR